jgi:hypothetical protein
MLNFRCKVKTVLILVICLYTFPAMARGHGGHSGHGSHISSGGFHNGMKSGHKNSLRSFSPTHSMRFAEGYQKRQHRFYDEYLKMEYKNSHSKKGLTR